MNRNYRLQFFYIKDFFLDKMNFKIEIFIRLSLKYPVSVVILSLKIKKKQFFIYYCVNDDADTMKFNKMVNACEFCNLFVFCRSYIRSEVSFKYLAAILDAILNFSKCSRVTGCHTADC